VTLTTNGAETLELREHTPRKDIQGLRALAVIVVVAFHAGLPLPGGFIGVDVFFVISGFVITGMLLRELEKHRTIRMRRFYARRLKRLFPALTLVLLVTLALTFLLGSPFDGQQATTAETAIGSILMVANGVIFLGSGNYFATPPTNNPLLNMWSLSVEEQFYLVFPVLLLLLWLFASKRGNKTRVLIVGLVLGIVASFALSVSMTFGVVSGPLSDPDWFAFYSSPTRAWEFGVGALVFVLMSKSSRVLPQPLINAGWWLGLAGIALSCVVITESSIFPGWIVLLPVLSTALVLATGGQDPWGSAIATNRPMVSLGDASYSWYLWHWPLIAFSVMIFPSISWAPLGAALFSLGLAALTLRFVENPIRFSNLQGMSIFWLGIGSVIAVVAVSVALIVGARVGWLNQGVQQMMSQVNPTHKWLDECNSEVPLGERGPECNWNPTGDGAPIYLVGDSMAGSLGEGLALAGQELGRPVFVGTRGACPFIDATYEVDNRIDEDCAKNVQGSLSWLESQPPSDVVISSTLGYLTMGSVGFSLKPEDPRAFDQETKTQIYLEALGNTVERLTTAGHRVTVALPPPAFPQTILADEGWRPSQCATYEALVNIESCGAQREEAEVIAETESLFSQVSETVMANGGSVWDPREELCTDGVCATNFGDEWLYLDASHISVAASEKLAQILVALLSASRSTGA
jgi:peptidoglycan/LPS O-acetylase OafA/YrhL